MSSPDPERVAVEEALEWWGEHRGFFWQQLPDESWAHIDRGFQAARSWLAGSSPDYEAAWDVLIEEDAHMVSGLNMTGVRRAVDAAFPGLFEEKP